MSRYPSHMTKELKQQNQIKQARKKEYQDYINKTVEDWFTFSTTPQSEEDIKTRVIHDKETKTNTCCISYICRYSKLSEEFIEWLDLYTLAKRKNPNSTQPVLKSKVDWDHICIYQTLSEEFIEKHSKDVNWKLIFYCQNISEEFKSKHLKDLRKAQETEDEFDEFIKDDIL